MFSVYPIPLWWLREYFALSYYHHQIGSMNYHPLFRVRSWNNSMHCMSLYILKEGKQGKSEGFDSYDRPSNLTQIGLKSLDFSACMTLKFDGWPRKIIGHLFYITSSFVHHLKSLSKFKLELLWKCSIWVKIGDFLSRVTLKFDGCPWKTIGHLFYATLSFVHHFKAISEFKLELQSGNAQFRSKSAIFCPVWP